TDQGRLPALACEQRGVAEGVRRRRSGALAGRGEETEFLAGLRGRARRRPNPDDAMHRGNVMRRVRALICLTLFAMAPALRAADYPTRPIRFVVPYVAGGPTDVLGRMVADHLTRDLKQTVFIENKGGAQGAIGAELVAHADPDGYTVLFTASSVLELNPM